MYTIISLVLVNFFFGDSPNPVVLIKDVMANPEGGFLKNHGSRGWFFFNHGGFFLPWRFFFKPGGIFFLKKFFEISQNQESYLNSISFFFKQDDSSSKSRCFIM